MSLKLYFIYRSVTVFLIIRYVLFCDRESLLGNCMKTLHRVSFLSLSSLKVPTQSAKLKPVVGLH